MTVVKAACVQLKLRNAPFSNCLTCFSKSSSYTLLRNAIVREEESERGDRGEERERRTTANAPGIGNSESRLRVFADFFERREASERSVHFRQRQRKSKPWPRPWTMPTRSSRRTPTVLQWRTRMALRSPMRTAAHSRAALSQMARRRGCTIRRRRPRPRPRSRPPRAPPSRASRAAF